MPENRITAILSSPDQQEVLEAINTIRAKLPFLIDLTPDERRTLPKMEKKARLTDKFCQSLSLFAPTMEFRASMTEKISSMTDKICRTLAL
jgi:hypothetical protein